MLFNSLKFLVFFPIVALFYYLCPHRVRYIYLLAASYFFYMCWNPKYVVLLMGSTVVTYFAGLAIGYVSSHGNSPHLKKTILASACILNLLVLVVFKYANFLLANLQKVCELLGVKATMPSVYLLLPVGISFYIFQALGYLIDVYRGEVKPERNIGKYALFVSFFPQLVAGPIERSRNLLPQFDEKHTFSYETVKENLLLMGWGFFLKIVIADRIAIFVDNVFAANTVYGGWYLIVAGILFAIQIYCDFAGYSTIAIGAAGVMGFRLMDNFKSPYCSRNIKEFWSRWHISLNDWFRDYLYIPLGGNRKGKIRQKINQMIVFLVSGLWHGAMWNYVIWGGLNGLYIIVSDLIAPLRKKAEEKFHINPELFCNRILSTVITFLLAAFSLVIFRANGATEAGLIVKSMFHAQNIHVLFDGSLYNLGLDQKNFAFMIVSILILIVADALHYRGFSFRKWLPAQNLWFRWLVYIALIESLLVFGIWGSGYNAASFIYFQF